MGKTGSFDTPKQWFAFVEELLQANQSSTEKVFEEMQSVTAEMKAAVVCPFPVPQFKSENELPEGEFVNGSELEEIARYDAAMTEPNKPDKVPAITRKMKPRGSILAFVSKDEHYYLYGPFTCREDMLATLKTDPMLKPVSDKWSTFDSAVLDEMFKYGTALYLQIKWQGWFVRPVLELNQDQLESLLDKVRNQDS